MPVSLQPRHSIRRRAAQPVRCLLPLIRSRAWASATSVTEAEPLGDGRPVQTEPKLENTHMVLITAGVTVGVGAARLVSLLTWRWRRTRLGAARAMPPIPQKVARAAPPLPQARHPLVLPGTFDSPGPRPARGLHRAGGSGLTRAGGWTRLRAPDRGHRRPQTPPLRACFGLAVCARARARLVWRCRRRLDAARARSPAPRGAGRSAAASSTARDRAPYCTHVYLHGVAAEEIAEIPAPLLP